MASRKNTRLNPLADSFVPSDKRNKTSAVSEMAEKYLNELIRRKEARGESLTKEEIAELVGNLISLRFQITSKPDLIKLHRYLQDKIIRANRPPLVSSFGTKSNKLSNKFIVKDMSKFQAPRTFLITCYWGLYRHEQSEKPLLSMTYRPEIVKDSVWSVQPSDLKLWNSCAVEKTCSCPPMFGYTIPPGFFGNIFNKKYSCEHKTVHLNHYDESPKGNEYILTSGQNFSAIEYQPIVIEDENEVQPCDLNMLRKQYENIISGLRDMLIKAEETITTDEEFDDQEYFEELDFWDSDLKDSDLKYSEELSSKDLVDDGDHPLLENSNFVEYEEVPTEIEEMIRNCFSPDSNTSRPSSSASEYYMNTTEDEPEVICDPPCSIWCTSNRSPTPDESEIAVEIKITSDSDIPTLNIIDVELIAPEPKSETKTKSKFTFADLQPVLDLAGPPPRMPKPFYKRSYSVNDCDPSYYDKLGMNGSSESLNRFSVKNMLRFLRSDPVNFFQTFNRNNSWKDNESGYSSNWSSNEDIDIEKVEDESSMWGQFSGDDSLWKPLPECSTPSAESSDKTLPHKRVRDLKRQRSLT